MSITPVIFEFKREKKKNRNKSKYSNSNKTEFKYIIQCQRTITVYQSQT